VCALEWPLRRFYVFAHPDEVAGVGSVEISSPTQIHKRSTGKI
jgi:hypothetical protein